MSQNIVMERDSENPTPTIYTEPKKRGMPASFFAHKLYNGFIIL